MLVGAETSDRFVTLGTVAQGGMGAVHRALDRRTGQMVALKLLLPESPEHAPRLTQEAEILAALDHCAVVRLIAHGTTPEGQPFVAMEWLDGEDLSARLDRGRLTPTEAATLGRSVAEALAAVHARDVVHRDIKPSNLFLPRGRLDAVKLLDFGIARAPGRSAVAGEQLGTPGYAAPEQRSGDVDACADLYSLGAVLFECLTGRPPLSGGPALAEDPPRVAEVRPGLPPALAGLVDRMLSRDRAGRPPSAAAVAEALSSLLSTRPEGEPPTAHRTHPPEEALTGHEQRLTTRLLVRSATDDEETARRIQALVAPLGGDAEPLAGGSTRVAWTGAEGPLEQAARAARCALLVRRTEHGAAIAIASRLDGAMDPEAQAISPAAPLVAGEIVLDEVTARLLDARFQVARGPEGLTLLGEDDFGDGARMLLGRRTPFVGRDRELGALRDLLDACVREGVARAALVTGPVGAGKSRLRRELLSAPPPRARVWFARGDSMGAGSAFSTASSALRSTTRVLHGEPLATSHHKLVARVAEHVPPAERARVAAFLGELVGVPFPVERCPLLGPARQSPARMAEEILRAWCDFVAAECRAHPVLLAIEDLHWGDTPSVRLLDTTLDRLHDLPFFVLALGRPEVHDVFPEIWAKRGVHEIRLDGLRRSAAEQLVRHVLGPSIDDVRVAQIVARASGNAFYLEELIRAAAEEGSGSLPETVLAVVQARLDALAPDERRVLRAASVLGETFWPGAVAALLGDGDRLVEVQSRLDTLLARELLAPRDGSRFQAEQELGFRHALVRDGAYAGLTEADRALAHGLAATWLERAGEDDAVVLAEHFDRAGQPERSIHHHLTVAARALMGNDLQSAIAHAARSLPAVASDDLRIERARILGEACWFRGDFARAEGHTGELLKIAPAGSAPWCTAVAIGIMLALERGSEARLTEIVTTFMSSQTVVESEDLLARIHSTLVLVFSLAGMRELAAHFLACSSRPPDAYDPTSRWFVRSARGLWNLFFEGNFWAAQIEHHEAIACSEQAGQRHVDAISHALLGWSWAALGALDDAERHLRYAIDRSSAKGLGGQIGRSVLVFVLAQRGELDEALAEARAACEAARGAAFMEGSARSALSYAHLVRGELDDADREASAALTELASAPMLRTTALAQVAMVREAQGRFREAWRAAREALGDGEPCRAHPFVELRLRAIEIDALSALGDARGAHAAFERTRLRARAQADGIGDDAIRRRFLEQLSWNAPVLRRIVEHL